MSVRRSVARRLGTAVVLAGTLTHVTALGGEPATGSARVRTSLVWIFGDDDALHPPGETTPPSPSASTGDRAGYDWLFEGFASRYTGRENRSELRLDGEAPGLFAGVVTRASLALGVELGVLGGRPAPLMVEDLGSFVEVESTLGRGRPGRTDSLRLRLFPLDGDRERVGELEALAWGGSVGPRSESPYAAASGPVRAGRLVLDWGFARVHLGLKTASFLEPQAAGPAVEETSYGGFGGVESRWSAPVAVSLAIGHFEHGRLPGGARSPRATTTGVSLRLSYGRGLARPAPPVGFTNDGSPFDNVALPTSSPAFALALEGAHLVERLWDFDHPGASVLSPARAAALLGQLRSGRFDLRAALTVRDPAFVMRNGPGAFVGQTLPRAAAQRLEFGAALSLGVSLGERLFPSLSLGMLAPAAVMTQSVNRLGQPVGATLVLRGPGDAELLPTGESPVPVLEARPGVELRLSALFTALAWLSYRRDFNRTRLVAAPGGDLARGFQSPDRLGYGVAARALW